MDSNGTIDRRNGNPSRIDCLQLHIPTTRGHVLGNHLPSHHTPTLGNGPLAPFELDGRYRLGVDGRDQGIHRAATKSNLRTADRGFDTESQLRH